MLKIITRQELEKFNGQNGNPSYVAFQGKVYDVSNIFLAGEHAGCLAGMDLTAKLEKSPHDESIFAHFTHVANLAE